MFPRISALQAILVTHGRLVIHGAMMPRGEHC